MYWVRGRRKEVVTTPDFFPLSGTFMHEEAAQGEGGILGCFARNQSSPMGYVGVPVLNLCLGLGTLKAGWS